MKIIIDSTDVDLRTVMVAMRSIVNGDINKSQVWTFIETETRKRIIVFNIRNKKSITFKVYYDKELLK